MESSDSDSSLKKYLFHLWPGVPTCGGGQRGGGVVRAAEAQREGGVVGEMARLRHFQPPSTLPSSLPEQLRTGICGKVQIVKLSEMMDINYQRYLQYLQYLHTLQLKC